MKDDFINPFSADRAEHLGEELWKFFVPHKRFEGILKRKSLMVTGGRGCGKTMFFLFNTYEQKKRKAINENVPFINFIKGEPLIGIHFRADSDFVTAFEHKGLNTSEWKDIFSHYFNLTISKRLCEIASDIDNHISITNKPKIFNYFKRYFKVDQSIDNFEQLIDLIDEEEEKVIYFVNNTKSNFPVTSINGLLFNKIVQLLLKEDFLAHLTFHVFVDEYENLLEYQQVLINTLIKHPKPTVVDIGMRKEGILTRNTSAINEKLDQNHDYDVFDFEYFGKNEFQDLVLESCKRRLKNIPELQHLPDDSPWLQISTYLGKYDPIIESKSLVTNPLKTRIKNKIYDKLKFLISNEKDLSRLTTFFSYNENPIINRLNLVLLDRGKSPFEIELELRKYLNKNPTASKYKGWYQNNAHGVVYLLAKEARKEKSYYGFGVFILLSSNIIRLFLEFCEASFRIAHSNGFTFEDPRKLLPEEQTSAVSTISEHKFNEIGTYSPYGARLKRFVYLLGNIYSQMHKSERLSEPEQNHFSTEYDKLQIETRKVIDKAIMFSILQKFNLTKDKEPHSISSNEFEFHFNHIFAPHFEISYRKKRRLQLNWKDVDDLLSEKAEVAQHTANKILKKITPQDGGSFSQGSQIPLDITF